jgi:hypothetical protein
MTAWKSNFSPKRKGRPRLNSNGLRRITKSGRRLNDQERREIEAQMRREGRLGGTKNAVGRKSQYALT